MQKEYTTDFLTKKKKKNAGEVPQYYVEGHHEAIISPELFDLVQAEILRRKQIGENYIGDSIFYAKIRCGECGGIFGKKTWHSTDKYRREVYQCNNKYKKQHRCKTPHRSEEQIKAAFVSAFNQLMEDKDEIVENMDIIIQTACNTSGLERELEDTRAEISLVIQMTQEMVSQNAREEQDQVDYQIRYDGMVERYETLVGKENDMKEKIQELKLKREVIKAYIVRLAEQDHILTEFDEDLWIGLVDHVTVYTKDNVRVTFKDGTEIKA